MKFLIVVLAFVAAATAIPAAYNTGQYNPFKNPQTRYTTPSPFRRFSPSTFAPPVYSTLAPAYTTPAPFRHFSPSTFAPPVYSTPAPVPLVSKVYNQDARNANIVKYKNEIQPDGSYLYFFETENGIGVLEEGVPRNFGGNPPVVPNVAAGSFSYTSPEGVPVAIRYIADENGFQPQGDVIPTPHPVPAQIARALEYIAKSNGQRK